MLGPDGFALPAREVFPVRANSCNATCASRCARDPCMVLCAGGSPYAQLDDGLGPG